MSTFAKVEEIPPDAIFLTKTMYQADTDPRKVNVGIGAYRDDDGNPYVLKVVKQVEKEMCDDAKLDNEYLPIAGDKTFVRLSQELMLGKDAASLRENRTAGAQSISGTGALRILCEFIAGSFPGAIVYLSNPTWGNHKKILEKSGLKEGTYRYWHQAKRGLDIDGMLEDISKAPAGSFILLHACAHNPTGIDPTDEQWKMIAECMQKHKLVPFFDSAYQGFATGDLDRDASAVRIFEKMGFSMLLTQSYAKNLGLYGQRIGCATIICANPKEAKCVQTQLEGVIRPMYSNPPKHGAEVVKRILSSKKNFDVWQDEMTLMSGRILEMRKVLRKHLEDLKTPGTWNHITDQIGMFSFTGLNPAQCEVMIKKWHIYLLKSGRISMAGVSSKNVKYLAEAINDCVTNVK